jgi:hypothetical protein
MMYMDVKVKLLCVLNNGFGVGSVANFTTFYLCFWKQLSVPTRGWQVPEPSWVLLLRQKSISLTGIKSR